jgi:membrane-associated progesterone receptor component
VFRTFTPRTLLPNNGTNDKPVYLAVKGKVYDVTPGRNFYGPGGPYENFAGRDATRGLAFQSFDEEMLTKDLDGPLDKCDDLSADQVENLNGWVERFDEKVSLLVCTAMSTASLMTLCSIWSWVTSRRSRR